MNTTRQRPDPDALLKQVQADEALARRGRLRIFFGGCAGTGKTYAMLAAAHERKREGVDVVAGVVETHGRSDTRKLTEGLESIPLLAIQHKGIEIREFNLDAAKARKPAIILMDELAHTNAPGSRHPKRWQDVEELLDAGIHVYSTLNVQHLESLSDIVAGVTGVRVKETVPDSVFDTADDIVLVDITADELLKRLREGKVYIADQAKSRAAENFFKKNNIIALRELALRRTTERVDAQMDAYNLREGLTGSAPVSDKIMVCIGPGPLSAKLIRTAKRMSASLKASWIAVYVENARHYKLSDEGKAEVDALMRTAERLGGRTNTLQADHAPEAILAYAKANGVTKIILGKTHKPRWRELLYGTLVDKIVRKSGDIDVYVVTGESAPAVQHQARNSLIAIRPELYAWALGFIGVGTLAGLALRGFIQPIDQAFIYLIGNVVVAMRLGRGPSFFYAVLSAACFNFFFIPPLYTFEIYDRSYWMTLLVMLATSSVITSYASRLRLQIMLAQKREQQTQHFYTLTRLLASTRGRGNMADVVTHHVEDAFAVRATVWMPDADRHLAPLVGNLPEQDYVKEMAVLQWCFDHHRTAGRDTTTMPSASGLYLPLGNPGATLGVMGVLPLPQRRFLLEEISSLETVANLLAQALERAIASDKAERATVETESEKLRNSLLSAVSHDLRTPLASITGAASSIAQNDNLPRETVKELAHSIHQEGLRLSHIVTNLLDVTRLESGSAQPNLQPYFIEEIIGSALTRQEAMLEGYRVVTHAAPDLPMVMVDGLLIEQVLANLIENAVQYTPPGTTLTISASQEKSDVRVTVADDGPGFTAGDERRIFDKFYTTGQGQMKKGTGLGLAICQAILKAHGRDITARGREEGGAEFSFLLPVAPSVPAPEAAHE